MHWAWRICKDDYPAQNVPPMESVDIRWRHWYPAKKSKEAAQEMVNGYGMQELKVAPTLPSRYAEGKAIDMYISWTGNLKIKNADGTEQNIWSSPTDETNAELIEVGKTYE
jgi:hypothetical protein